MSFITNFMKNVKVSKYKEMNPVKSFKKVVEKATTLDLWNRLTDGNKTLHICGSARGGVTYFEVGEVFCYPLCFEIKKIL